jgi:hypothetical protein
MVTRFRTPHGMATVRSSSQGRVFVLPDKGVTLRYSEELVRAAVKAFW